MTTAPHPTPAPVPGVRAELDRVRLLAHTALSPFWVVPTLWCLAAVALGLLVPQVDQGIGDHLPFLFGGGAAGARSVLSSIAGAMISVTGVVFSITIVVLQLASSQFSPRVLGTFLESRITQHTLGVFAASFLYALTVLRSVVDTPGSKVPQLGVTLAYLLVVGAVAMFMVFIHHITQSISVANIIRRAADETRSVVSRGQQETRDHPDDHPDDLPDLPALGAQSVATATSSGYLDTVDQSGLLRLATGHDVRIELLHPLGTFVVEGTPVALVHGAAAVEADWDREVSRRLGLRHERSTQQDASFGVRRLVDIAERALSPGINDPTTAVQVINELHDILRRMARAEARYPVRLDGKGVPRLVTRELTFEEFLDLAIDEIAHYGAESLQVPRCLDAMLQDLEATAIEPHRGAVAAKAAQLRVS